MGRMQLLPRQHDFSAEFTQPIDTDLAAFLQSGSSVQSLLKGGALRLDCEGSHRRPIWTGTPLEKLVYLGD